VVASRPPAISEAMLAWCRPDRVCCVESWSLGVDVSGDAVVGSPLSVNEVISSETVSYSDALISTPAEWLTPGKARVSARASGECADGEGDVGSSTASTCSSEAASFGDLSSVDNASAPGSGGRRPRAIAEDGEPWSDDDGGAARARATRSQRRVAAGRFAGHFRAGSPAPTKIPISSRSLESAQRFQMIAALASQRGAASCSQAIPVHSMQGSVRTMRRWSKGC